MMQEGRKNLGKYQGHNIDSENHYFSVIYIDLPGPMG
jgi:hypothetical protein